MMDKIKWIVLGTISFFVPIIGLAIVLWYGIPYLRSGKWKEDWK